MSKTKLILNFSGRSTLTGLWLGAICGFAYGLIIFFNPIAGIWFLIPGMFVGGFVGSIAGMILAGLTIKFFRRSPHQLSFYRLVMNYAGVFITFVLTFLVMTKIHSFFGSGGRFHPALPLIAAAIASIAALFATNMGVNWFFRELKRRKA